MDAAAGKLDRSQNKAAADLFFICRERFPAETSLRLGEARAAYLAGDPARADVLLSTSDDDPSARLTRAQAALAQGRAAEAVDLFDLFIASFSLARFRLVPEGRGAGSGGPAPGGRGGLSARFKGRPFLRRGPARPWPGSPGRGATGDEAWRQWSRLLAVDPKNEMALAETARLKPFLTKTEEEIIPSHHISASAGVELSTEEWSGALLRVGLAVDAGGRPQLLKEVSFRASAPFRLTDAAGEVLAEGPPAERWTVRDATDAAVVLDSSGTERARFTGAATLRMNDPPRDTVIVEGLSFAEGFSWAGKTDKEVRGALEISRRPRGLRLVAQMPLEAYLQGVVGAEMPSTWPVGGAQGAGAHGPHLRPGAKTLSRPRPGRFRCMR